MIDHLLKKYIPRLLRGMHREFKVPVQKQKKLLNSFNEPQNNFDRSFYQYKCQELFWGKLFYLAASIAAAVLLPYQLYRLKKNREEIKNGIKTEQIDLILVADEMPEGIFPPQLLNEYPGHKRTGAMDGYYFSEEDESFFRYLKKRYWNHPYFLYKCLMKQAGYSYIIHTYNPKVICACGAEFTYTSSYLTQYCNFYKIKHYNTMHGEMFYYVLDAFICFDRFYVWNSYYKELLQSLRAKAEFIIDIPDSVKIDLEKIDVSDIPSYDMKYYLQMQEGKVLENIAASLNVLQRKGYRVCVRYHPRTINLQEIKRLMPQIALENPRECPIEHSIKATKYVVGLNSTVLFQAYTSGKGVIIDDVSNADMYKKLEEMKYMMIGKCPVLSEFI